MKNINTFLKKKGGIVLEANQISQLLKSIGTGGTQSAKGVLGNDSSGDASSSFGDLLNQIVNNSQDKTLNNTGTSASSIDSKDNIVNGVDSISLQSQKAQQLQQVVMQQMMQIMTSQDTSSSSSVGSVGSDDSSDSLFPSTKSNNDLSQLIQAIAKEQTNTSATTNGLNNSAQANASVSQVII